MPMLGRMSKSLLSLAAIVAAASAQAAFVPVTTTITFEDLANPGDATTPIGGSFQTQGYNFNIVGGNGSNSRFMQSGVDP